MVSRHLYEAASQRMQQRTTPQLMRLRRATVEHPFAFLKYRIFGHPRFLLRGLKGAKTEICHGLQPKTHADCNGRNLSASCIELLTIVCWLTKTLYIKKAMPGTPEHRFLIKPSVS
jgi:hypothetical protein